MSSRLRIHTAIACVVLVLHVGALLALQHGLLSRNPQADPLAPLMARLVEPPPPRVAAPAAVSGPLPRADAPKPPAQVRKPTAQHPGLRRAERAKSAPPVPPTPAPDPTPQPPALAATPHRSVTPTTTVSAANTPSDVGGQATGAPTGPTTGVPVVPVIPVVPAMPKAPPVVELPSSDAYYLQNPAPKYPPISLRLREQGTVLIDVLVSDQGLAKDAKVKTSSGFFRLDNAAVSTVSTWRFVPGKRAGIPQSMWFTVPIVFRIQ